jgi:hypothetical protein
MEYFSVTVITAQHDEHIDRRRPSRDLPGPSRFEAGRGPRPPRASDRDGPEKVRWPSRISSHTPCQSARLMKPSSGFGVKPPIAAHERGLALLARTVTTSRGSELGAAQFVGALGTRPGSNGRQAATAVRVGREGHDCGSSAMVASLTLAPRRAHGGKC